MFQQVLLGFVTLTLVMKCAGDRWGAEQDPEGWAHDSYVLACHFF
jgi:hypothetical protein